MSIVYSLLLIILFLWVFGLWLRKGEDLTVFDHPVEAAASEVFLPGRDCGTARPRDVLTPLFFVSFCFFLLTGLIRRD